MLESLDPAQQLVGIVHRELVALMGPVDHSLHLEAGRTTVLMLCGLQGSGKTTSCAKLARRIKDQGRGVMLVAADLQRPAAIEQLAVLVRQLDVPVHLPEGGTDPVAVCNAGVARARREGASVVILDTAGRLAIDAELMRELATIDRSVGPDQVYLVVDAMTGQDAVRSAKAFNDALEIDGVIMTKLDGDARGGAALSVKSVTGVPIKFIGTGEQIEALEDFHPERLAGRILSGDHDGGRKLGRSGLGLPACELLGAGLLREFGATGRLHALTGLGLDFLKGTGARGHVLGDSRRVVLDRPSCGLRRGP